jgi:hypothetical protein
LINPEFLVIKNKNPEKETVFIGIVDIAKREKKWYNRFGNPFYLFYCKGAKRI